jgi:hypothetical protein
MFLGAYIGVGLVLTIQTALDSFNRHASSVLPNSDLLAIPLMIVFFIATGLRFGFDMPAVLPANWIFRLFVEHSSENPRSVVRKIMLGCVFWWQLLVLFPVMYIRFTPRIAVLHTATALLFSTTLVEFLLLRFQKIPFTCSTQPDIPTLLMRILGAVFGVILLVPVFASVEESMLQNSTRFLFGGALLTACWCWILHRRRELSAAGECPRFEDAPPPQFELLKLT